MGSPEIQSEGGAFKTKFLTFDSDTFRSSPNNKAQFPGGELPSHCLKKAESSPRIDRDLLQQERSDFEVP